MNNTLKLLMISDIFVVTGFGLIEPILAVFFKENLAGASLFAIGLASTIFLITKSIVQLPFSKYVDSHDHKVRWLIIGTVLISIVPLIYIFATDIKLIYLAKVVQGIGAAMAYPTWLGLFSTHLDRKHESFEWSVYSAAVGVGTAISAAAGGALAQYIGFNQTFMLVSFLSLIGCFILFKLERKREKTKKINLLDYHKGRKLIRRKHPI